MSDEDNAGRYSLLGRYGELLDVIMMRILACADCGAVVADTAAHDRWHERTDDTP